MKRASACPAGRAVRRWSGADARLGDRLTPRSLVRTLARRLLDDAERARLEHVALQDAGHGYDVFGAQPDWIAMGAGILRPLYERWFRVTSTGIEHIPAGGAAIRGPGRNRG